MHTLFATKVRAGLVAGAMALGVTAMLPAQTRDLRATVPFAFESDGQHFNAGVVQLQQQSNSFTLIESADGRHRQMVLTHAVQQSKPGSNGKLVFHRYGNRYFLSEMWLPGETIGRTLNRSRGEKEMQIAAADHPSSNVVLALNRIPR